MRMPRLRFTVRGMMVAVAAVAVAIVGIGMERRHQEYVALAKQYKLRAETQLSNRQHYLKLAGSNRELAQTCRDMAARIVPSYNERNFALPRGGFGRQQEYVLEAEGYETRASEYETKASQSGQMAAMYLDRKARYERAAFYPCPRVAPDPPAPK
jgi:hypothetical protein